MRAHFDGVHTPSVRTHGRPTHRNRAHPRLRRDAVRIGGAIVGVIAQPPRPGGQAIRRFMDWGQVVHPCGQHLHAPGCACCRRRTGCTRRPKTFSRFAAQYPQNSRPRAFRPRRARTRRQTGRGRLSIMNPSPVVNTSPPRQIAQLTHHRRRPFVMTANIPGGDDGNRQNLGVGDLRPHIPAMPQVFHQRVDHDNSGDNPRGVHRLLPAMMLVQQPRSCQRCRWSSTSNQGSVFHRTRSR